MKTTSTPSVPVWDIAVRIGHWLVVVLVVGLMVSGNIGGPLIERHAQIGQVVLAWVLFRLLWGFGGSAYARFSQFVRSPAKAWAYARGGMHEPHLGHNPLGGWMVLALLLLLLCQALLGLMANDDISFTGPWASWVGETLSKCATSIHKLLPWLLLALIAMHVLAVVFHQWRRGEPLIQAMFHGRKPAPEGTEVLSHGAMPWFRLLLCIVVAVALSQALIALPKCLS